MARSTSEVSQFLQAWNDGVETALEKLMPLAYNELHRMARHYMARESPGHTLQTTALVDEAYVRLVDSAHNNFQNRIYFLAVCAQAMRRILVDLGAVSPGFEAGRKNSAAFLGRGSGGGGNGGSGFRRLG